MVLNKYKSKMAFTKKPGRLPSNNIDCYFATVIKGILSIKISCKKIRRRKKQTKELLADLKIVSFVQNPPPQE